MASEAAPDFQALDLEAASYVQSHGLEECLSAAVDHAIQLRADNPIEVIILQLQKVIASKGGMAVAPAAPPEVPRGMGPGRSRDAELELHVKARSQENPGYPARVPVTDEAVRWTKSWPSYAPSTWTHEAVLNNSRDLPTGHKWADPPDAAAMRAELEQRITYSMGDEKEHTFGECLTFDGLSRPVNPVGRTGLAGRGLLGKWGSNHAADPIVTRFHPTGGQLQVVAIQRKDTLQWALPGGMVDPGEHVSVTVKREFSEEAGAIDDPAERAAFERDIEMLFRAGQQVYRGYVDDPRATDNAWMETTAFHFHCSPEIGRRLPLKAGDDAGQVMWLDVSMADETYCNLYGGHRSLIDEAVWGAWGRGEMRAGIVQATAKEKLS